MKRLNSADSRVNDAEIEVELEGAGINRVKDSEVYSSHGRVSTHVSGELGGWKFSRDQRYWVAKGPAIPRKDAVSLYESHGGDVRVDGVGPAGRATKPWGDVSEYHVDSQEGLNALASTIKRVFLMAILIIVPIGFVAAWVINQ